MAACIKPNTYLKQFRKASKRRCSCNHHQLSASKSEVKCNRHPISAFQQINQIILANYSFIWKSHNEKRQETGGKRRWDCHWNGGQIHFTREAFIFFYDYFSTPSFSDKENRLIFHKSNKTPTRDPVSAIFMSEKRIIKRENYRLGNV